MRVILSIRGKRCTRLFVDRNRQTYNRTRPLSYQKSVTRITTPYSPIATRFIWAISPLQFRASYCIMCDELEHDTIPKRSSARLKRKRTPDPEQKSSEATKRNKRTKISEKTSSQSKEKQSTSSTIEQTDIPAKPTDSKHRSVGAHVSIQGGFYKAILRIQAIGGTAFQIFTKSNKSWSAPPIKDEDAAAFRKALQEASIPPSATMVHATYLINLASSDAATREKSLKLLTEEAIRCDQLGIPNLVLHPGSHTGGGIEQGIKLIAEGLDKVYNDIFTQKGEEAKVSILLETAAGQGTAVGAKFSELKRIRDACTHKDKIGICLDTCHIYSAGYDISTKSGYEKTMEEFEREVGFDLLKAVHINNSQTGLAARVDRHAKIVKGTLPLDTFRWVMNDSRFKNVPLVLETPGNPDGSDDYEEEIALLQSLVS